MIPCWKSLLAEGLSLRETAARCGVSASTIHRRARRAGYVDHDAAERRAAQMTAAAEKGREANKAAAARRREETRQRAEAIRERIKAGMGVEATARDVGVSKNTVARHMAAEGVMNSAGTRPVSQSIAERVADMKPADAVEFLIAAYDNLAGAMRCIEEEAFACGMTPAEAQIFGILRRHQGRAVTHDMLVAAMDDRADAERLRDTPKLCKVYICKMRRKLDGTGWTIETVWGVGYRLEHERSRPTRTVSDRRTDALRLSV